MNGISGLQRHGKVHAVAVVDVAQQGLRLPNGTVLKGFSKFEDYAGSQAHRPCEFSLTLAGHRVQVFHILHAHVTNQAWSFNACMELCESAQGSASRNLGCPIDDCPDVVKTPWTAQSPAYMGSSKSSFSQ